MAKVPDLNIPGALQEAYFNIVAFGSKLTENTIRKKRSSPARRLFFYTARFSFFIKLQPYYDALSDRQKLLWKQYWTWLDYIPYDSYGICPGSGFCSFLLLNTPLYKTQQPLLENAPYSNFKFGTLPFSSTGYFAFGTPSYTRVSQEYTPTTNITIEKIALGVENWYGKPTDNLILNIYRGGTNPENGTRVLGPLAKGFQVLKDEDLPHGPAWLEFVNPLTLQANQKYYFTLTRSGTLSSSLCPAIVRTTKFRNGLTQPQAKFWYRTSTSWTSQNTIDYYFLTY